jgi:hypothetical protein
MAHSNEDFHFPFVLTDAPAARTLHAATVLC